jgi:hypothetical protein
LFSKSKAVAFSLPSVPPNAHDGRFDPFDDTFQEARVGDVVSYESEAYAAFLASGGQCGELSVMKNEWMRRMRQAIVSKEKEYQSACDDVRAHEAAAGFDRRDRDYQKKKAYIAANSKEPLFCDHQEGHATTVISRPTQSMTISATISEFHLEAIEKFLHQQHKSGSMNSIVAELAT